MMPITTTDPVLWLIAALAALAGLMIASHAALRGWREWIALRRLEIERRHGDHAPSAMPAGSRIELADLKERVRKLEAIAAGVDL